MSALPRPAVLATLLAALALLVHPAAAASAWLPAHDFVRATLALLVTLGFVSRAFAERRLGNGLVALGGLVLVLAVGADGARGRQGTLSLAVGQARGHFEEVGRGGRALGLRPLGFEIGVGRVTPAGEALLLLRDAGEAQPSERLLGPAASVAFSGFRFGEPRLLATGGAARLRVSASDGTKTSVVDVVPGRPALAGDLVLTLEEYFADFALDAGQRPFSRSIEPRNPGALLNVQRGGQSYRAFVLRSMPGVHRIEPLGVTFSLLDVEPEQAVTLSVHSEPFAWLVLLGALLTGGGLVARLLATRETAPPTLDTALVGGAALAAALLLADQGRALAWAFTLATAAGPAPLAGVGPLFGLSLVAALAGTLLLTAESASGSSGARPIARGALWLAVAAGAGGCALGALRAWGLPGGLEPGALRPLGGVALAVGVAVAGLRWAGGRGVPRAAFVALAVLALAGAVAAGVAGVSGLGSYATAPVAAGAAVSLLGLCAAEEAAATGLRALGVALGLLAGLVRPL